LQSRPLRLIIYHNDTRIVRLCNLRVKELSPITIANVAKQPAKSLILLVGGPERTRTSDLRFRKPLLYPAELRDRDRRADIA
jgi:hypothetical protein